MKILIEHKGEIVAEMTLVEDVDLEFNWDSGQDVLDFVRDAIKEIK